MERYYKGALAGVLAGIPMNIWSFISFRTGFTRLRYLDWAGVLMYGTLPQSLFQQVYSLVIHLLWVGFLGAVFIFLIPKKEDRQSPVTGMAFAMICAFFIYAIPVLLQVPYLHQTDAATVLSNHLGALVWGASIVWILRSLEARKNTPGE